MLIYEGYILRKGYTTKKGITVWICNKYKGATHYTSCKFTLRTSGDIDNLIIEQAFF